MIKLTRRSVLVGTSVAALPAFAQQTNSSRVRLRVADIQSADYPTVQALYFMDRKLREDPQIEVDLQIFSGAQLGEEKEIIEQTRAGAIDMARVNVSCLSDLVPLCSLLSAPGLMKSDLHLQRVVDSEVRQAMASAIEGIGLVLLSIYPAGARQFYARRGVESGPPSFRGRSISVQSSALMRRFVAALGATPVELGFGQILPALQAGIVDGAENTLINYVAQEHYLSAPYLWLTNHSRSPEVLLVSKSRWSALSADRQSAIANAARDSEVYLRRRWIEWTALAQRSVASTQIIKDEGIVAEVDQVSKAVRDEWISNWNLSPIADRIATLAE